MSETSEKTRVLVVDEVQETANVILVILQKSMDCEVTHVSHPSKANAVVSTGDIDLVICEAFSDSDASLELCQSLRSQPELEHVPVILYSGKHDRRAMLKGFEAGAVDYLFKPLFPMELAARVKTHFLLKRQKDLTIRKIIEQRELIHLMCHDLTGPIGASLTLLELAKDDPQVIADSLGMVTTSLKKALELADLVRQMQAIEDGKTEWVLEEINLRDAIENAASIFRDRLGNKSLTIQNEVESDIFIKAEKVSFINSVLANLISNAIKFSEENSEITLSSKSQDGKVLFSIEDVGIGIPDELLPSLFDLRTPTSRLGTRAEPGTGYGLPLVKKFVTLYGGAIDIFSKSIESHPRGHGTRVQLTLNEGKGA